MAPPIATQKAVTEIANALVAEGLVAVIQHDAGDEVFARVILESPQTLVIGSRHRGCCLDPGVGRCQSPCTEEIP